MCLPPVRFGRIWFSGLGEEVVWAPDTDRQTDIQTDRHTDRQTDRQTVNQTYRQTDISLSDESDHYSPALKISGWAITAPEINKCFAWVG